MRTKHFAFALILAAAVAGCVHYTIVPPAVDLASLGTIGLVTLRADNAKGDLDVEATQLFLQEVTAAQRVPIVELGMPDTVLADVGRPSFDRDAVLAIGEKQGIEAVFVGEIEVTKVKPQIDLADPLSRTLFARAAFDIAVKVRLISTKDGATLWTDSAVRQGTVGAVGLEDGVPVFSIRDKSAALNEVLRQIMYRLTWDFRPTRMRI